MIVHRHGQGLLGVVLADAIKVQLPFDDRRLGDGELRLFLLVLKLEVRDRGRFCRE